MSHRTKPIEKEPKTHKKKLTQKPKKPITNEEGEPIIKHLHDFVTSIKNVYTNKPIYTGGRIVIATKNIYASCNTGISVYNFE